VVGRFVLAASAAVDNTSVITATNMHLLDILRISYYPRKSGASKNAYTQSYKPAPQKIEDF
jgi:hypothetical protein